MEANKQTKSTATKRARQTPQGMAKEGQDPFFLCEGSRKRVIKKRRKAQRGKNGERVISIPWNSEKRSEKQEQCE